jgi:hypothetical protein
VQVLHKCINSKQLLHPLKSVTADDIMQDIGKSVRIFEKSLDNCIARLGESLQWTEQIKCFWHASFLNGWKLTQAMSVGANTKKDLHLSEWRWNHMPSTPRRGYPSRCYSSMSYAMVGGQYVQLMRSKSVLSIVHVESRQSKRTDCWFHGNTNKNQSAATDNKFDLFFDEISQQGLLA